MKKGYCNGSDMLVLVGGKAIGHCTTHTVRLTSETKDRAVKPVATAKISAGLWKGKGVTGLSINVSADGLCFYGETESGYRQLLKAWKEAESVELKCLERESDTKPYLVGKFVVASLERTDPAQDDSTFSVSFDNDGEPTVMDEEAITEEAEAGA